MSRTVEEAMSPDAKAVSVHATIAEAAKIMRDHALPDVLVTDDGRLCGVVSERDLAVRAVAGRLPGGTPVAQIYGPVPVTCAPKDDVEHAAALLRDHEAARLPVVDDGRLVGVIGTAELARLRKEV